MWAPGDGADEGRHLPSRAPWCRPSLSADRRGCRKGAEPLPGSLWRAPAVERAAQCAGPGAQGENCWPDCLAGTAGCNAHNDKSHMLHDLCGLCENMRLQSCSTGAERRIGGTTPGGLPCRGLNYCAWTPLGCAAVHPIRPLWPDCLESGRDVGQLHETCASRRAPTGSPSAVPHAALPGDPFAPL